MNRKIRMAQKLLYDVYIVFQKNTGCPVAGHVVRHGSYIPDYGKNITIDVLVGHNPYMFSIEKDKIQLGIKFEKIRNYRFENNEVVFISDDQLRLKSLERFKKYQNCFFP